MDSLEACRIFLCFLSYSFLGWICECIYCSIPAKRFINRGFLNGPLCPVYGFGALLVIYCLTPVENSLFLLYICGMGVTSVLEYVTSWLLEVLFHTKWWDYSHYKFNIHGRVCLLNSLMFGALGVIVMKGIHPFVSQRVEKLSMPSTYLFTGGFLALILVDLYLSVRTALQLDEKLQKMQGVLGEIKEKTEAARLAAKMELEAFRQMSTPQRLEALLEKGESLRLKEQLHQAARNNILHRRMLDAFPTMRSMRYPASLEQLKERIRQGRTARKEKKSQN